MSKLSLGVLPIPENVDELVDAANGVVGIIHRGGWWTAAAVYAWTEPRPGKRSDLVEKPARLTYVEFAGLGIRGLRDRDTVRQFRAAWSRAIEEGWAVPVRPGDTVRVPSQDFTLERPALTDGEERANARLAAILPPGKHNVIYADPPWRYDFSPTDSRAIENQYPTLELEQILGYQDDAGRPIHDAIADDAALFLWATSPKLPEALAVVEAWGFTYTTQAVWVKDRIGMGFYFRQQHELLLVGKRGSMPPPPDASERASSVIEAPYLGHSVKPDAVYELIESMYPTATRLECFQRRARPGWAAFGNEPT